MTLFIYIPNTTKYQKDIYTGWSLFLLLLSPSHLPLPSTMEFPCTFCPKVFDSEIQLSKHKSTCSLKTSCVITLSSKLVTVHRNSNNQWPCYCDLPKCKNKIFLTHGALQKHILRDAKPDTKWKVCCF